MLAIEAENPSLKGVLPKDYARAGLDKQRLGQLIDLVSNIGLGDAENRSKDVLGRVYEYFLSQFASAEGKKGGQFYTPPHVVRLLVEMLAPYKGRVYDPCCGSGGMFVQSEKFIEAHGGKIGDISVYGQESNYTTWRLAAMNLAIRGIDAQIGHGDTFHNDRHPDLKADYVLANPPFNDSDWRGDLLRDDGRWVYGDAARGQRQLCLGAALSPPPRAHGDCRLCAGQRLHVVQPVGRGGDPQGARRGRPGGLHGGAARSALLLDAASRSASGSWRAASATAARCRPTGSARRGALHRRAQTGLLVTDRDAPRADRRRHGAHRRHLPRLAQGRRRAPEYADVPGFCRAATLGGDPRHGHVLTPGRYVGGRRSGGRRRAVCGGWRG